MITDEMLDQIRRNIASVTFIVEATTNCNLNCSYCYVSDKTSALMNERILEEVIRTAFEHNGKERITKFIWHGGEPLLAGLDFYKKVVEIQKPFLNTGYRIANALQTNALLLTDEWIDFFIENEFGVGSSLDGIKEIHDQMRVDKGGHGTFKRAIRNIKHAIDRGLHVGAICVLTRKNVEYVTDMYHFFKHEGIDFTLSPIIPTKSYRDHFLSPEEYANAIITLFDLWFWDKDQTISVNPPFSVVQGILLKGLTLTCTNSRNCINNFISVKPNGDIYPCNRFADYPEFCLGNISTHDFHTLMDSDVRKLMLSRRADVLEKCSSCDVSNYCNGGCMNHAFEFYGTIFREDYYCESFKRIFNHIHSQLMNQINHATISTN